jgi:hypothetical protein
MVISNTIIMWWKERNEVYKKARELRNEKIAKQE